RQLIADPLLELLDLFRRAAAGVGEHLRPILQAAKHDFLELLWLEVKRALPVPDRRAVGVVLRRDAIVGQARAPLVVENDRPEEPETALCVDKQRGVAVG